MSMENQVNLRSKKLGVLIRDARMTAHKTSAECAQAMGVGGGILKAYEEGRRSPSLPELELLAYYLNLPITHFWSQDVLSDNASPLEALNVATLTDLRQSMIGAMLRKMRSEAGMSVKTLGEKSGLSSARLRGYELGEIPIPLPVLEGLAGLLDGRIEMFFDQSGPVGRWLSEKKVVEVFLQLPAELQAFVSKPINRPYLELALSLSGLSTEKLRSVAESLLDITL